MTDDKKPAGPAPGMNHADVAVAIQADKDARGVERNTQFLKIDMHTYDKTSSLLPSPPFGFFILSLPFHLSLPLIRLPQSSSYSMLIALPMMILPILIGISSLSTGLT